jgi:hypothetical protein
MADHHPQSQDVSFRVGEMLGMAIKPLERDSEKRPGPSPSPSSDGVSPQIQG